MIRVACTVATGIRLVEGGYLLKDEQFASCAGDIRDFRREGSPISRSEASSRGAMDAH